MSKDLLGKWAREKEQGGDYEVIEVIDTDGLRAYVKGPQSKPISINDLGTVWKRMSDLVADPFASSDLAALRSADPSLAANLEDVDLVEEAALLAATAIKTVTSPYIEPSERITPAIKEVIFESASPEETAIEAVIKASTTPATITLTLEVEVPIDLDKISIVSNALSIDRKVAASVVAKMTKIDIDSVQTSVANAILDKMNIALCK